MEAREQSICMNQGSNRFGAIRIFCIAAGFVAAICVISTCTSMKQAINSEQSIRCNKESIFVAAKQEQEARNKQLIRSNRFVWKQSVSMEARDQLICMEAIDVYIPCYSSVLFVVFALRVIRGATWRYIAILNKRAMLDSC